MKKFLLNNLFILLLISCLGISSCFSPGMECETTIPELPALFPDYSGVTFPSNIAPISFIIKEEGDIYHIEFGNQEQVFITKQSKKNLVSIAPQKWKKLLKASEGGSFYIKIRIKKGGEWIAYKEIINQVSDKEIDPYLVYRLIYPGYELWNNMGIYQRDLTSYKETPVMENSSYEKGCMNCHTFNKNSPETMMVHVRGKSGGTLVRKDGALTKIGIQAKGLNLPATYPSWHPGGRYIAYSTNEVSQFFHSTGSKAVEVSDSQSDLILLDTETNTILTDSLIYGSDWMETFPNWSPDGKQLYYCRAKGKEKTTSLDSIYYDLCRITFDESSGNFGKPEVVYAASATNKSVSFPRVSPSGKYLMFVLSDYGNFSIWHPESELALLDLTSGVIRIMHEVNSEDVDSFHSWSSTGNWFVFSSKRIDGLWAHPYIAYFDEESGTAGKPFILPQKHPAFYTYFTRSFNLPELITAPITYTDEMVTTIKGEGQTVRWN